MKNLLQRIKKLIAPFPFILNILRILKDTRYFYHIIQGKFTSVRARKNLRNFEKLFYKKRISLKEYFVDETMKKEKFSSFVKEGILINPISIEPDIVDNIKDSLQNYLCHDPENNEQGYFLIKDKPKYISRAYYQCEDLVKIPAIMKIANDPRILAYVSKYMGVLPRIDSIYAWWSFPSENKALTQSYHRDIDTLHAVKFFIYLTDVNLDSGPHIYIKSSMKSNLVTTKDKSHLDNEIESEYSKEDIVNITGESGFNFLGDLFSFHKGLTPLSKPRLLLQIYYSLNSTPFGPKKPFIDSQLVNNIRSDGVARLVNKNIIRYPIS